VFLSPAPLLLLLLLLLLPPLLFLQLRYLLLQGVTMFGQSHSSPILSCCSHP